MRSDRVLRPWFLKSGDLRFNHIQSSPQTLHLRLEGVSLL